MKTIKSGDTANKWAKLECPCGCGGFTYVTIIDNNAFSTVIPGGASRTHTAIALWQFRKEIQTQLAILKQIEKGRAFYASQENSKTTIH